MYASVGLRWPDAYIFWRLDADSRDEVDQLYVIPCTPWQGLEATPSTNLGTITFVGFVLPQLEAQLTDGDVDTSSWLHQPKGGAARRRRTRVPRGEQQATPTSTATPLSQAPRTPSPHVPASDSDERGGHPDGMRMGQSAAWIELDHL